MCSSSVQQGRIISQTEEDEECLLAFLKFFEGDLLILHPYKKSTDNTGPDLSDTDSSL